jgi:hypothetical protein
MRPPAGPRRIGRKIAGFVLVALAVAAAYAFIPRKADLAAFEPAAMARAETLMWRHYYDKRYVPLFLELYGAARNERNFSPWDSLRIAVFAAGAARTFQPSTSRAGADAALPQLRDYFRVLARGVQGPVDIEQAARTELDWWQARREAVKPEQYGLLIARVSTLLYGIDNEDLRKSGVLRAQAMEYRDARNNRMTEADWSAIDEQLRVSYGLLKSALATR